MHESSTSGNISVHFLPDWLKVLFAIGLEKISKWGKMGAEFVSDRSRRVWWKLTGGLFSFSLNEGKVTIHFSLYQNTQLLYSVNDEFLELCVISGIRNPKKCYIVMKIVVADTQLTYSEGVIKLK